MFKLLLLVVGLHGSPAFQVDVGLNYDSQTQCELDVGRASGMLNRILEQKYGTGSLSVVAHRCEREV